MFPRLLFCWFGTALLSISFLFAQTGTVDSPGSKKDLAVEDLFSLQFRDFGRRPRGLNWLPDGRHFSYLKTNRETRSQQLWMADAADGNEEMLLDSKDLAANLPENAEAPPLQQYQWEPDGQAVVLPAGGKLWRYHFGQKKLIMLLDGETPLEEVHVSPDGKWISYVRSNDLYIADLQGREVRLTSDGSETILNGKLDWVYQEELVGRGKFNAYFWSPNSDRIAFLRFDQAPVPEYPLVDWEAYHPEVTMMRYPKAGDANSIVQLGVVAIADSKTTWLESTAESDAYIPRVYWLPSGKQIAWMRLSRRQQQVDLVFADTDGSNLHTVISEKDPHWVNVDDFVYFFRNKNEFLWGSERSGYNHLYLYDYNGKLKKQLTKGDWLVDNLCAVNEADGSIYFTNTKDDLRERQLYRINRNGKNLARITGRNGMNRINMSNNSDYFICTFSSSGEPSDMRIYDTGGKERGVLVKPDRSLQEEYRLSTLEQLTFTGDNGITYYGNMLKPPDFNPDSRYPVLIYVYGGPHAQVVQNNNSGMLWHHLLAQKGYIVFSMDNRGAAGRGHAWETPIHKNMGKTELEDQLRGVEYLKTLPYVDGGRIGIWGWSYGGYLTLYALTHSNAFRAGIAVAPVTDWRNYDTAYTERYMGLPAENEEGYLASSPAQAAAGLSGALLLVHGTGDDNVHLQNAIHMADKLIDADKPFQLMLYPNQTHGIASPQDRTHLFRMLTVFLDEKLKGLAGIP